MLPARTSKLAAQQTNPLLMTEGNQEGTKTKRKEYFRCKALVLAANPQTTVFFNTNIRSLHLPGEFFCRMMQTSNLNHNLYATSHFGIIGKHYRSCILLMGRIVIALYSACARRHHQTFI